VHSSTISVVDEDSPRHQNLSVKHFPVFTTKYFTESDGVPSFVDDLNCRRMHSVVSYTSSTSIVSMSFSLNPSDC